MKNKIKNLLFDSQKGKVKLNDKASIFFFCLLLATFFWFLSSLSKQYTTTLTIPIEYTSFNKDFIITKDPIKSITVRVSGSGFELFGEQMSLNRKSIKVRLDQAKRVGKNRSAVPISTLKNELLTFLDKDLNFIEIQTDSIVFITQPRITKTLQLIPHFELEFVSGYNLIGDIILTPSKVSVSGPQEVIDSLSAIQLEGTTISDVEDTVYTEIHLSDTEEYKELQFKPEKVEVLIPVEKFTEKVFEVPILQNSKMKEMNIQTFPNSVKAIFLVPLSNYEKLVESDFSAKVRTTSEDLNKSKLKVEIEGVPNFAKLLRIEPERVEYIIKK